MDPAGQLVNEFSRKGDGPKALEPQPGMNRFLWDMRYAAPPGLPDESGQSPAAPAFTGPLAVPGTYRVRLTVGEEVYEESFELLNDPSSAATQADLEEQLGLELSPWSPTAGGRVGAPGARPSGPNAGLGRVSGPSR